MSAAGVAQGTEPARIAPEWLGEPAVRAVLEALGGSAFFVGGCVRNALLGAAVSDIDLATPLTPAEVTRRLEAAGLRAVPTGIEHGTVTAIGRGRAIEITTFRADVETDGRHAVVRFTTDLAEDAERRDFTMNALYADAAGRVIDPVGGLADLRAGRVRFIGEAEARIREDRLRILRFFRFTAWYGREGLDADGLAACAALAEGVEGLARERVGAEMRKLLAAPDPAPAVAAMAAAGVLARTLPGAETAALALLVHLEGRAGAGPDWLRRLAVLRAADPAEALRLSRAEARVLARLRALADGGDLPGLMAEAADAGAARSAMLIRAAERGEDLPDGLEAALAEGAEAVFPLSAADLIAAGWHPGPALGRALAAAHARWRASGFRLDRDALLAGLGAAAKGG